MSGKSVTCIKLHLFTTDWTWTYMTVPLSYIIPQVCLWIFFGIVTVKTLVKVLMFLKEILMCFQFNFPCLNKVCRIKKNNQIKIKLLLKLCDSGHFFYCILSEPCDLTVISATEFVVTEAPLQHFWHGSCSYYHVYQYYKQTFIQPHTAAIEENRFNLAPLYDNLLANLVQISDKIYITFKLSKAKVGHLPFLSA